MSLVVNTNIGSLNAMRSLASSGNELKTAMERLSSGKKINSAADDAAGFAIAERMTAQIRGLNMATKNANDGLSMLAVIENATNDVTDMLQRMRELAVQATNDTNSGADRQFLQAEALALRHEIDRVASQTEYNGAAILDGSRHGNIQVGTEAGQTIHFHIRSIQSSNIGAPIEQVDRGTIDNAVGDSATGAVTITSADYEQIVVQDYVNLKRTNWSAGSFEVTATTTGSFTIDAGWVKEQGNLDNFVSDINAGVTIITEGHRDGQTINQVDLVNNASEALATITSAIEQIAGDRAEYGALQNRLEYTVSNLMNVSEFTTAARSRIEDADFAAESARLAKAQVLQQTGTAMLAQANSSSQLVLSLIR
ncbi:flagellin [Pseudomonadales bacterium]|nr:flagellin [Pseudomonadales bacterium]